MGGFIPPSTVLGYLTPSLGLLLGYLFPVRVLQVPQSLVWTLLFFAPSSFLHLLPYNYVILLVVDAVNTYFRYFVKILIQKEKLPARWTTPGGFVEERDVEEERI